jgi:hypothetical protein
LPIQIEGLVRCIDDPLRQRDRRFAGGSVGQYHGELVTTDA